MGSTTLLDPELRDDRPRVRGGSRLRRGLLAWAVCWAALSAGPARAAPGESGTEVPIEPALVADAGAVSDTPLGSATPASAPGEFERIDVEFDCQGLRCAAWLYRPLALERPPVVVMGHGFGGTRRLFLPDYAERFARAGFAVFVFDYRSFGDSPGEPRQLVRIDGQLEDWRAALRHVRGRSDVDVDRVALWGTSLSGGHVLEIAAQDPAVVAVVAQVPYVDGDAGESPPWSFRFRALWAIVRDYTRSWVGSEPYYVPVISPPDRFGAINSADAYAAAQRLIPETLGWRNEIAARGMLELASYRPVLVAPEITAPVLLMPAVEDELIPIEFVRALAERMPHAELVELEGGHFDSYGGPLLDPAVSAQLEFLGRWLRPPTAPTS